MKLSSKLPGWLWAIILYCGGVAAVGLFSLTAHYLLSK